MTKIVLFELNEVPFRVLDDFAARRPESALARLLPHSAQFRTRTQDRLLSPWVTWPSLHRGAYDTEHGIQHFGQDLAAIDGRFPPLWKTLRAHGAHTGVFASLHSYPPPADAADYAFYVPDPFAAESTCYPPRLRSFQELNLRMSRQSARNVSTGVPWAAAARFAADSPRLGLRAATVAATLRQLAGERRRPWTRVRRRTFQTVLAFDLFEKLLRDTQPDFCTFFTNHVASSMHRYWAAAYPADYETMDFDAAWRAQFQDEIDYAMRWFDAMIARLEKFVHRHPEYEVWVASSMGQAATSAQPCETQLYITDLGRFMQSFGIAPGEWSQRPAMAPEVSVFVNENRAPGLRAALATLQVAGRPLHHSERERGFFMISAGHENLPADVRTADVGGRAVPLGDLGLENVAIEDQSTSSAYHVPEGSLWILRAGAAQPGGRPVVGTIHLAPAILRRLGAAPAAAAAGDAAAVELLAARP